MQNYKLHGAEAARESTSPRGGRERERGRLLFVLFVDYTNNVRRPAKRREEKECGGGKVRDGEWERAGIKRSRYKAGY